MRQVLILNKSSHDFSEAKEFGELVYLTEGKLDRFAVNSIYRTVEQAIMDSDKRDYIVPCSLNILNIVVCSMFVARHNRLNLLIYNGFKKKYLERNILFSSLKN